MSPSLVEFKQNVLFFKVTLYWEQKQESKGVNWVFVALSWPHVPRTLVISRIYAIFPNSIQICYMSAW